MMEVLHVVVGIAFGIDIGSEILKALVGHPITNRNQIGPDQGVVLDKISPRIIKQQRLGIVARNGILPISIEQVLVTCFDNRHGRCADRHTTRQLARLLAQHLIRPLPKLNHSAAGLG